MCVCVWVFPKPFLCFQFPVTILTRDHKSYNDTYPMLLRIFMLLDLPFNILATLLYIVLLTSTMTIYRMRNTCFCLSEI
jgi:hypothetical protein